MPLESASAERQRIAEEVASMLKLKVELNNNSTERFSRIPCFSSLLSKFCILHAGHLFDPHSLVN